MARAQDMAAKAAAALRARRDLVLIARTDAAASARSRVPSRARLYVEAGADATFPEALTSVEMFRELRARMPDIPMPST
ncbi:MAG: hypothetical protein P3W94_000250 [Paracoccus sp. (in: a-proteobacteria)]|nr:hypothetical protein [Paracoccus sp. (in: a-proteobacteria)]